MGREGRAGYEETTIGEEEYFLIRGSSMNKKHMEGKTGGAVQLILGNI